METYKKTWTFDKTLYTTYVIRLPSRTETFNKPTEKPTEKRNFQANRCKNAHGFFPRGNQIIPLRWCCGVN